MKTLISLLVVVLSSSALAQVCSADQLNRDLQTLRRLSLDLKGRGPTRAEYDAAVLRGGLAGDELDAMLVSPEFKTVMRERVKADVYGALDLDWQNGFSLELTGAVPFGDSRDVFWNRFRTVRSLFSSCDVTREQTQFTPDGVPVPAADGREGWVWVAPYWAPQTRIKVCAYDAQAHLRGPQTNTDCSTGGGPQAIDCGCGPNLSFCQLTVGYATNKGVPNGPVEIFEATEATLDRAFAEQMLRFTDRIIDTQRPWSDLLLSDETEVNGPIAHYLRWQTGTTAYANLSSRPNLGYVVPSTLEWTQKDNWVRVRSTGKAAGLLTQPAWLLKFATNRARANRFYNAFLCSVFQAPPGGLPSSTEPCAQEPNLARRCGCDSCHQTLEPMAAYWGRFAERGTHELLTPEFPTDDPTCVAPSGSNVNTQRCQTFYVTRARIPAEQPWVGKLKAYAYADDFNGNIDDGPLTLARNAVNTGDFARCTVTKEFERLVGRPFNSQLADERALQDSLTTEFIASNHDLRRLLRRILESRQYRSNDSAGGVP
ncbi:MAG: hypothetical protein JNM17_01215 [Archangium sp.]|nr:hypothetical protein [Archangium sp.]